MAKLVFEDIYSTYDNRLSQSFLLSKGIFDNLISGLRNQYGQIYLKQSENKVKNDG